MMSSPDANIENMRTTINIDAELLSTAQRLTGINDPSHVVQEALRVLIQRESARHLIRLGGSEPQLKPITRRR
jgi:Arc/MetJ family transcription regulator